MIGTVNFDGALRTDAFTAIEVGGGGGGGGGGSGATNMVRRRLSGIVKTSGEKLNQSNRLAAPTCTSRLKNALGTGLVLAIGLALSSSNSKVMPRKEQTSFHGMPRKTDRRKGFACSAVKAGWGVRTSPQTTREDPCHFAQLAPGHPSCLAFQVPFGDAGTPMGRRYNQTSWPRRRHRRSALTKSSGPSAPAAWDRFFAPAIPA